MSIIVEFSIPADEFVLGQLLTVNDGMWIEMERLVPTESNYLPFFWASGGDQGAFEREVRRHDDVNEISLMDSLDGESLYEIDWDRTPEDLTRGIRDNDGVVLQAVGEQRWEFSVRFREAASVSDFHGHLASNDHPVTIERAGPLDHRDNSSPRGKLTAKQLEAVELAVERGYFDTPRGATLGDLADHLGISEQAVSVRLRRGIRVVMDQNFPMLDADGS